jgi:RNA polymerase sigma factor (sigma-70 family)
MENEPETPALRVPAQFDVFYRSEYAAVVALIGVLTGSGWAAEDIAQEAFLRVHRDWEHVGRLDSPEAWVRRVAINLARSRWRRLRAESAARLRLGSGPTWHLEETRDDAFWDEVRRLPRRQAQAVALRYIDDLPVAVIAEIMDAAEGTIRALLHQGRERLERQLIAKGWVEP